MPDAGNKAFGRGSTMEMAAMAGLRVLELTDQKGSLCGRLLADMGADVIKVEPPGGDPSRRIGPFLDDQPHPDRSLFFWFYNLNKRGMVLDYTSPAGAELLLRMVDNADIVIESLKPGRLDEMGLGWDVLHRRNPALILCSITPFGQTGPYRDYEADDTVAGAMGGLLYICGYPKEKPVRAWGLQSYHSANYYAAVATIGALFARERDGMGQWVDVSMQESTDAAGCSRS
jgi:crotonobetainyl-CoA:carnitine CoA-transferase CaiB-like acyl-CoA transferase